MMATGAWQTMAKGLARGEGRDQQSTGIGVLPQVLHRTVAAGVVHGVVVVKARVGQLDWPAQLLGRSQDLLLLASDLLTAGHRRPQAHHVQVRHDAAGGGHHHLVAGSGDCAVRGCELFGPVTGRMPGAVLERPITCSGHHEKDLGHQTSPVLIKRAYQLAQPRALYGPYLGIH
jgi:hypothetical protein